MSLQQQQEQEHAEADTPAPIAPTQNDVIRAQDKKTEPLQPVLRSEEEAKRLKNLALFDKMIKGDMAQTGSTSAAKGRRKSIGLELATEELKHKPTVNLEFLPAVAKTVPKKPFNPSEQFFKNNKLTSSEKMSDCFHDFAVSSSKRPNGLPALDSLSNDTPLKSGDVVIFDKQKDPTLAFWVSEVERLCISIPDRMLRFQILSLFVSNALGGSRIAKLDHSISDLHSTKVEMGKTVDLLIGTITQGDLRHRALLFKYLADSLGMPSELIRSTVHLGVYWNIVEIDRKPYVMDVMHRPACLYPLYSISYYSYTQTDPPSNHPACTSLQSHQYESLLSYDPSALSSMSSDNKIRTMRWILPQDLTRAQLVLLHKLGSGGCGSVWEAKLGGFTCAIKIVNTESMNKAAKNRVLKEVDLLQKLQHRHIVAFLGKEVKEKELHIFMELVPHSLFELIQQIKKGERAPFDPEEIICCISHMAKGLMYLHGLPDQVIHRDIKSKNVLVELSDENQINHAKLCDFGVSKIATDSTQADTSIGTSRWMAPEVVAVLEGKREAFRRKVRCVGYGHGSL